MTWFLCAHFAQKWRKSVHIHEISDFHGICSIWGPKRWSKSGQKSDQKWSKSMDFLMGRWQSGVRQKWHFFCKKHDMVDRPFYILNLNRRTHFLIKNTFFSFFGFFFSLALLGWTPKTCHVFCTFFSRFFESPLFMSPLENPWILIKCCTFLVRKNCARKHVFLTF